jgi:thymidylate synthase (FAD)
MNITIVPQTAELCWITPNSAQEIEKAGRTCYRSEDKITNESAARFVESICASGHESVIEHASASFQLTTDRGITHEIVRHRVGCSYSQESTRYVGYTKKLGLLVVEPLDLSPVQHALWFRQMESAAETYEQLINSGCKPQQARDVLPTCTAAQIRFTATFRAWKHFLRLRTSPKAHPKIRVLAGMIQDILQQECSAVFGKPA